MSSSDYEVYSLVLSSLAPSESYSSSMSMSFNSQGNEEDEEVYDYEQLEPQVIYDDFFESQQEEQEQEQENQEQHETLSSDLSSSEKKDSVTVTTKEITSPDQECGKSTLPFINQFLNTKFSLLTH
ncbi:unnamed protein product [Ambrosiozyma monospora]|uniref:Unnamed protein product n=1 Tax=Ambrosiozyma monospora TaxID=43982 RepID=A0ACB5TY22_AMBMO|nr:unnamed protein product [Ambrosiozyma monospora]